MKKNIILAAATVIALFSSIANSSAQKKAINVEDRPWGVAPWEYATQMDSHIDFEGVDLGQPYDKFISEVESKGFKTLDKQKRFTIMRGTWKGFAETKIVIYHKGIYNVVRKDFFACSGLDEKNLENLTDHNLNIGHEDDFRMKALHREFDGANCAWETIVPLPEGTLTVNIHGKKEIGNAKARYTKGRFQIHAIYRDNCLEDILLAQN